MQYQTLLSLLALTSFVAAVPVADVSADVAELDFDSDFNSTMADIERRDGEDRNAFCRRSAKGVDHVEIFGGCGDQAWGIDANGMEHSTNENLRGCGAVSDWQWTYYPGGKADLVQDNSNGKWKGTYFKACWGLTFKIPHKRKDNCLGKKIKNSNGPAMKCQVG